MLCSLKGASEPIPSTLVGLHVLEMFFHFNADFKFLDCTKISSLAEHVERIRAVTSAVRVLVYVTWPAFEILLVTAAAR